MTARVNTVFGWCVAIASSVCAAQPVIVTVDMDAAQPGIQRTVRVAPGATLVEGIAVYIYDPSASHRVLAIGFIGGLNRGISLGHTPRDGRVIGRLIEMIPTMGTPAIAGNLGFPDPWGIEPGFVGPEVQYIESGVALPGPLPAAPTSPLFTVDVTLRDATPGDIFPIYLLDMVTVWSGGSGGAFSTRSQFSFDTGGDAVPDRTLTLHGIDPDAAITVPPAAFEVDYVDGPIRGGGATIIVDGCYADCDQSTGVGVLDIFDFLCFQNGFVLGDPFACDCDTTTGPNVCDLLDFLCFQNAFVAGCP